MISVETILEEYVPFGTPIPFNNDWKIYPVKVSDYFKWHKSYGTLTIDKNSLNNIEIIKMSYLRFILMESMVVPEFATHLDMILRMCLHIPEEKGIHTIITNTEASLLVGDFLEAKDGRKVFNSAEAVKITEKDFDEIKRIILYQNIIGYDDSYIDPEVREAAEEYYRLKYRDATDISLEHKIAAVQAHTGISTTDINNMTLRGFQNLFNTVLELVDYSIAKLAEAHGAKFEKPIEHWAFKKKKNKFSEAFTDFGSFAQKIASV